MRHLSGPAVGNSAAGVWPVPTTSPTPSWSGVLGSKDFASYARPVPCDFRGSSQPPSALRAAEDPVRYLCELRKKVSPLLILSTEARRDVRTLRQHLQ